MVGQTLNGLDVHTHGVQMGDVGFGPAICNYVFRECFHIYAGQTRNGVSRLDSHNQLKVFQNKAIMFLTDRNTFSLYMIHGLETYRKERCEKMKGK